MTAAPSPAESSSSTSRRWNERRSKALVLSVALHFAVFTLGLAVALVSDVFAASRIAPRTPTLTLLAALVTAWASLGAIWWARSRWPSHLKTLSALGLTAACWALFMGTLPDEATFGSVWAVGWGGSLLTQTCVAALAALLLDWLGRDARLAPRNRFSILFLLIWTTVIAILLGAGRWLTTALGWTPAHFQWAGFFEMQLLGLGNALVAIGLWSALDGRRTWQVWLGRSGCLVLAAGLAALVLLAIRSGYPGRTIVLLVWFYSGQTLFLLATLGPLKFAAKSPPGQPALAS